MYRKLFAFIALAAFSLCVFSSWSLAETNVAETNKDAVAVIIGNKDYAGAVPDVDFAHNDAAAMKRFVVEVLGFREGNVIDLRDAGQAKMEAAFGNERSHEGKLWRWVKPGQSDVVVFYSGHGVPGLNDRRGYLLPVDADPDRPEINGYPVDVLYANLAKLKARSVTVYLDACFSGESPNGMLARSASNIGLSHVPAKARKGITVLTAARGDQLASWDEDARHGLFTRYLLEGLYGAADGADYGDGDGAVTVAEIQSYLDDEMTYQARRRFGRDQEATVRGRDGLVLASVSQSDFVIQNVQEEKWTGPKVGATFRDCPECPEMVVVPAGEFMMGSPENEDERDSNEGPLHQVVVRQSFAIGMHEVTFAEWDVCAASGGCKGYRPDDAGWERGKRPVINVSYQDAQRYTEWLSQITGHAYRLPSEAEWEYAARAGTVKPFFTGSTVSTTQANYDGKRNYGVGQMGIYRGQTVPVGSFSPNLFGVHDMHGNVLEWVEDCWNESYANAPSDTNAWVAGNCNRRVLRGGAWIHYPRSLRSAARNRLGIQDRHVYVGFRVVRAPK